MNYATRTFSAIYFLQFSHKESCWQSFNLGFQLGEKEQKKDLTALRCSICTAIYLFTIHYFLNALSWKQNSECSLSFSALESIPHCCSVLTFQDPSKQLLSAGCQLEVERLLSIQSSNTHSKQPISSLHLSQQSTQTWSRTNTCARAWRLKYTKYRIFNHVYGDPPPLPPPQTPFNESRLSNMFNIFQVKLLAQRFSVISAQETAAKAKEEHGEEQKPTQVQGECFCSLSSIIGKVI